MTKIEKRLLEFLEEKIFLLAFIVITILSIYIRFNFRFYVSVDARVFLIPWYTIIKCGGPHGLAEQVGDYNMLYQLYIYLAGRYLPVRDLYIYKMLSITFDYILAVTVGSIVYHFKGKTSGKYFVVPYAVVIMAPIVFLNSSCWSQCDVVYTAFVILALRALQKEKYPLMMIFYGLAFAFKLQAIFMLPFFLFMYFRKKEFSIVQFLLIPATMLVTSIPNIIAGSPISRVFTIYADQTGTYKLIAMNYPSFWRIFMPYDTYSEEAYAMFKNCAMVFTVTMLIGLMVYWTWKKYEMNFRNMMYMAFLICYTCVLFLPAMHERYGYTYEILALVLIFLNMKTIPLAIGLHMLTFITYGNYLFTFEQEIGKGYGLANLIIYVLYIYVIDKDMKRSILNA